MLEIKLLLLLYYTHIFFSGHLATGCNNKILPTPPPHNFSSEEILPLLTRRTIAQQRTNKSPFLKSTLHKVETKLYQTALCPLCNTHTHNTHNILNCTYMRTTLLTLDMWTDPPESRHYWPDNNNNNNILYSLYVVSKVLDGEADW